MALPKIPKKIRSFLPNIFRANITLLPESFLHSIDKTNISKLPNILQDDNITDQFESSHQSYKKIGVIKCFNYNNFKKPGKAISVLQFHNIFYVKRIFQSHIYIIQVLSALVKRNNLGLSHYFKLQNYQEA